MTTIEIAVKGLIFGARSTDHYWRVRWLEDGAEVDHVEMTDDLAGMASIARAEGGVAWRYYETDVFADAREQQAFIERHGVM